jgi:hypothetical protein
MIASPLSWSRIVAALVPELATTMFVTIVVVLAGTV